MKTLEWTYPPRAQCVAWPIYRGGWPGCHRWVAVLVINMQGPGVAPTLAPTAVGAQRENYWHFSTCHIAVMCTHETNFYCPCSTLVSSPFKASDFKVNRKDLETNLREG